MIKFACFSVLVMTALFAARPATSTPAAPAEVAGGCGWWSCGSEGAASYPSSYVCRAECPQGPCTYVNICAK